MAPSRTSFGEAVEQLDNLLKQLTNATSKHLKAHPLVPSGAGVYLFSENGKPMYVGQGRNLRRRLTQHTSERSHENSASFAFNLALETALKKKLNLPKTRKQKEADPAFAELFLVAKQRVAAMEVQFIEIPGATERYLFEPFATDALGTHRYNSFETH